MSVFVKLLEREAAMTEAEAAFAQAAAGHGQILLVSGEAGIGKTSFVQALQDRFGDAMRFLSGGCDELSTPRPYGPFLDLARQGLDRLGEALSGRDLSAVLDALLDDLSTGFSPSVVVIEDIHWADNASIDALTTLARRVGDQPVTLVLTYRDLPRSHPAFSLVGGLPQALARRIELRPLSVAAVGDLAGVSVAAEDALYASTGGNPFFVTELLAARQEGVPATVADAVLARTATLPDRTRQLLELLSVIPNRVSIDLLDELSPDWLDHVEPAEERGIVEVGAAVRFRHALTRQAIEVSLSETQRRRSNRWVLALLLDRMESLAQIVHHAKRAGDAEALADYAPQAAREAAAAAAHREAIDHFRLAIEYRNDRPAALQADLHDELSRQLWFDGRQEEALSHALQAVELLEGADDAARLGSVLRSAANLSEWCGDAEGVAALEKRAIEVLEPLGPSADLAMLYADLGIRAALELHIDRAGSLCERGVGIAEELGDSEALAVAYTAAAYCAHWAHGRADAWDRAIAIRGPEVLEATVVAHANRSFVAIERAEDAAAEEYLREAADFAREHQATVVLAFTMVFRARLSMERGRWNDADGELASARNLVDIEKVGPAFRIEHDYCAGRLASRRGHPEARSLLERAWSANAPLDQLGRCLGPAAALAEHAALENRMPEAVARLQRCAPVLDDPTLPWSAEIAYWLWLADAFYRPIPSIGHPRYLSMRGEWEAAAAGWEALGRPYERAEALTRCADVEKRLDGLAILDELDAAPLAAATRRALRESGVENVPRGPNRATRHNPAGLTARQLDVLALLADGRTNAEIAEELFVSVRTVDTHVGAILQKLGAETRRDAARRARELGVV